MKDVLKQRLVGALVIIALGVIFWPLLFVKVEDSTLDRSSRVPAMPVRSRAEIPAPRPLPDVAPVTARAAIDLHLAPPQSVDESEPGGDAGEAGKASQTSTPRPALDADGIPIAWALQVITVSDRDKARALTDGLIERGYKAFHRPLKRDGRSLHQVYIGPVFDQSALADAKQAVDKQFDVDSIVARYIPQ